MNYITKTIKYPTLFKKITFDPQVQKYIDQILWKHTSNNSITDNETEILE